MCAHIYVHVYILFVVFLWRTLRQACQPLLDWIQMGLSVFFCALWMEYSGYLRKVLCCAGLHLQWSLG